MAKEGKSKINKLKDKYRLIIYNDNTFKEVWSYKLSRLNVFTLVGTISLLLVGIVFLLIAFTPLKVYIIPGYPKAEERMKIEEIALKTDSLTLAMQKQEQWAKNIITILNGGTPKSYYDDTTNNSKTYDNLNFARSKDDSLLRAMVEKEEAYSINVFEEEAKSNDFSDMYFFPPTKGIITNSFDPAKGHFGTDVVSQKDATVHSVLDGTVVLSSYTIETGHIIQIQHRNDLISIYKHNKEILKKVGENVKAGEAIAIVGNTGELSTGPHLHFELWYKGEPINSENFILFE